MRLFLFCLFFIGLYIQATAQKVDTQTEIIELATIFHNNHVKGSPDESTLEKLKNIKSKELVFSKKFILEIITEQNSIISEPFLTKPDTTDLKNIYIISRLNHKMFGSENVSLFDELAILRAEKTPYNELVNFYYDLIFSLAENKNKGLTFEKINFNLDEFNLSNDVEKGIFFLNCMNIYYSGIKFFMDYNKPPKMKEAKEYINKYPKFNGQEYYNYKSLAFQDFVFRLDKRKPKESFKQHYINIYLQVLFYNYVLLVDANDHEQTELYEHSILSQKEYWKFSTEPEVFEELYKMTN
ncbi:hypothetical protein [Flammeovirga agarivorans]|uniref:Uncharacterized protein n=1 Tax=Flammeovirga agarivorans TaxID=2726742 RepID=A0A7X8SJG3_9BACT|nr:hypothetical protein [Flammeovirga agarivorans]NLR91380.1 hypothetical protein [Flammeovirga agarivorans]